MNKFFRPPDAFQIAPLEGCALLLDPADLSKMCGTFTLFETVEQARIARHDFSLRQLPDWHTHNCAYCKTGYMG